MFFQNSQHRIHTIFFVILTIIILFIFRNFFTAYIFNRWNQFIANILRLNRARLHLTFFGHKLLYKFLNCFIKFLFDLTNNIACLIVNNHSQRRLNLFAHIFQHRFDADKHQLFCLLLCNRITLFNVANTLCNQLTFSFFSFNIVRFYEDFFHFIYKCFTADILHESLVGEFLRGVNDCLPIVCLFHVIFKLLLIDIQFNFSRNKVFAFIVYCLCWIFAQNIQNFLDCHLNSSFWGTIFLIFLSKNVTILRKVFLL